MVRYTSGYICVAVTEADADRLDLPPMFHTNQDRRGTAYTVTVDARVGVVENVVRPRKRIPVVDQRQPISVPTPVAGVTVLLRDQRVKERGRQAPSRV